MSGGMEAGEHCEVVAGFMAWYLIQVALAHLMKSEMAFYLIQVALAHLMKNEMAWYLSHVALAHLMKMATSVCTSTTNIRRAHNLQEQLP